MDKYVTEPTLRAVAQHVKTELNAVAGGVDFTALEARVDANAAALAAHIGKPQATLVPATASVVLPNAGDTATVAVTTDSDGELLAVSSDTDVATVSVSGRVLSITAGARSTGAATITARTAETATYAASLPVAIHAFVAASPVLADNDWATISRVSASGLASALWNIGDLSPVIHIAGTVGTLTLSGDYQARLIGIDHNAAAEGSGLTFMLGTVNGANVAFYEPGVYAPDAVAAGATSYATTAANFVHNTTADNSVGWANSNLKTNILPQLKDALPTGLQAVIKPATKWTATAGNDNTAATMAATSDNRLFLLSEYELAGTTACANQFEADHCEQYEYFKNGNPKDRCKFDSPATLCEQWLRSPLNNATYVYVRYMYLNGAAFVGGAVANWSLGIAPCFVV